MTFFSSLPNTSSHSLSKNVVTLFLWFLLLSNGDSPSPLTGLAFSPAMKRMANFTRLTSFHYCIRTSESVSGEMYWLIPSFPFLSFLFLIFLSFLFFTWFISVIDSLPSCFNQRNMYIRWVMQCNMLTNVGQRKNPFSAHQPCQVVYWHEVLVRGSLIHPPEWMRYLLQWPDSEWCLCSINTTIGLRQEWLHGAASSPKVVFSNYYYHCLL